MTVRKLLIRTKTIVARVIKKAKKIIFSKIRNPSKSQRPLQMSLTLIN